jgi:hypothetical protein
MPTLPSVIADIMLLLQSAEALSIASVGYVFVAEKGAYDPR